MCIIESLTTEHQKDDDGDGAVHLFTLRKRNERFKPKQCVLCSSFARQKTHTHIPIAAAAAAAAPTTAAAVAAAAAQIENE